MILQINLETGEVRDPAVGVVGQIKHLDPDYLGHPGLAARLEIEIPHERVVDYVKRMERAVTF